MNKGDPEVKDIRSLMYEPSSYSINFKLIFDEPYCKIPQKVMKKKMNKNENNTEDFFHTLNVCIKTNYQ